MAFGILQGIFATLLLKRSGTPNEEASLLRIRETECAIRISSQTLLLLLFMTFVLRDQLSSFGNSAIARSDSNLANRAKADLFFSPRDAAFKGIWSRSSRRLWCGRGCEEDCVNPSLYTATRAPPHWLNRRHIRASKRFRIRVGILALSFSPCTKRSGDTIPYEIPRMQFCLSWSCRLPVQKIFPRSLLSRNRLEYRLLLCLEVHSRTGVGKHRLTLTAGNSLLPRSQVPCGVTTSLSGLWISLCRRSC